MLERLTGTAPGHHSVDENHQPHPYGVEKQHIARGSPHLHKSRSYLLTLRVCAHASNGHVFLNSAGEWCVCKALYLHTSCIHHASGIHVCFLCVCAFVINAPQTGVHEESCVLTTWEERLMYVCRVAAAMHKQTPLVHISSMLTMYARSPCTHVKTRNTKPIITTFCILCTIWHLRGS